MELRMYGLVNYQLTGIQKGIQFGHAAVEYSLCDGRFEYDLYRDWAKNHKTFILLNGGTTNNNPEKFGTMQKHLIELREAEISVATFYEPDLNDALTAIVFIVDERAFNKEKCPDFDLTKFYGVFKLDKSQIYQDPMNPNFPNLYSTRGSDVRQEWDEWVEYIGGAKNLFLRSFLVNFKKA